MASEDQFLPEIAALIGKSEEEFKEGATVQEFKQIPSPDRIPQRKNHWYKIRDVISVFVDMKGSTELSAAKHDKSTAELYQFFTDTMVRILHSFGASYIDVKGDGVFGLFNVGLQHSALAGAVSCKTFAEESFAKEAKRKRKKDLGCHIGIDQKTVLVKRVGIEPRNSDDSHLRNEVWAGKPVNMSAKLAARAESGELLVSDRFYGKLTNPRAIQSCGCGTGGDSTALWEECDVTDDPKYDFGAAYLLRSRWCVTHGKQYCSELIANEKDQIREVFTLRGSQSILTDG